MTRSSRTLNLIAAVAAVFALACAVDPAAEPPSPASDRPTASSTVPGQQEDGTMTEAEFASDLNGAVEIAESYWTAQFDNAGQQFKPIRQLVPYRRSGEVACGDQPLPGNNAAYCSAGDFIAYDSDWAVAAFQKIGDAFLFYLLGHEYAHGVQLRLGHDFSSSIDTELQADCMAGAYIGDSVRAKALSLQDGDLEELRTGLAAVGDDPDQPWFAPNAHGTAAQRTRAFFAGYERSLGACNL
ncbi:MAG: hypothetical protein HOV71_04085 [Hamadaea sp.]|nr:hypothetical protein [Hamadaea sp.]NUT08254.1 hypothetical protein [Hamadaea sp.]